MSVTLDRGLVMRDSIDRKMDTNLSPEEHLRVHTGDIAYNMMRMWQGASGIAETDGIVSPAYVVLAPKPNVDPLFASYLFKTSEMIHKFWAYSYGLTDDRLRLYPRDFTLIPATLPPLPEQQKIAEILSTWDKAIETTEALLANARTQKRALMQSLLTGTRRFPGFEDHPWREVRLGDVGKIEWGNTSLTKSSYLDAGFPAYSAAGRDGYVETGEWNGPGIVLSAIGARCGKCFWADGQWTAIKNTIVVQTTAGLLSARFFFHIADDPQFWPISGGAQPFIGLQNARKIKVKLPSYAEQELIAAGFDAAEQQTTHFTEELDHLRTEKKSLMQQLLTGKRRVVV